MEIMRLDHGFDASSKMYKMRLARWGYFKNNRKVDTKLASQPKKGKEAAGNPAEIRVDAGSLPVEMAFSNGEPITLAPAVAHWAPSPKPVAMRDPDEFRMPSRIFSCISTYMWGSYDGGRWTPAELASAAFYEHAFFRPSAELINSIGSLASLLQAGKYRQAGPLMRLAAIKMENVLRAQPVDLLTCLLEIKLRLHSTAPELVASLIRYSADITKIHFPSPEHPVRILTRQLATLGSTEVAAEAYACQLKVWQDIRDDGFRKAGDSVAVACVWITGLVVAAGFQNLPSRLIPRLDDLMLRMATAMKGSEWCEELLQSLAESGNIQMFSCDVNGKVLEISMQLPGKPAKVVGAQPIARYRLAHLNARCRHFAAEERSRREAMEVRWLLETEMGSFFMRMVGAIEGWLDEIQEHDRAAAVARYREKFMAAGSVDVE